MEPDPTLDIQFTKTFATAIPASECSVQFNQYQQTQKTLSQVVFVRLLPKLQSTNQIDHLSYYLLR